MYAIAFDMYTERLREHYGASFNNAYNEIERILKEKGFEWKQGSLYTSRPDQTGSIRAVYSAISTLKDTPWFKLSVKDIRVFKIEDWSDFTPEFRDED